MKTAAADAGVAARVAEIRQRIGAACARCGRDPGAVTLVGASKRQPVERLLAAWEAGLRVFGENRVQEAQEKRPRLPPEAEWHLLGPLQSNKVKAAVELFDVVHSVDRVKIARALDRQAAASGRRLSCFLEVNLGEETSKHGFPSSGLADALRPLAELPALRFLGLMAIPPPADRPEDSRPWFRTLRELRGRLAEEAPWLALGEGLSMGMSADFEVAIEEGATHVRVGTALFGPRGS